MLYISGVDYDNKITGDEISRCEHIKDITKVCLSDTESKSEIIIKDNIKKRLNHLKPYGWAKNFASVVDKYDIQLLSYIGKPKLCIRRVSFLPAIRFDKGLYCCVGTLLDCMQLEKRIQDDGVYEYKDTKLIEIGDKYIYVAVLSLPFGFKVCDRYKIKNKQGLTSFLTKLVLFKKA